MTAVTIANNEIIQYNYPKFHNNLIFIHIKRRYRKEIDMIDLSDESPRRSQFQFDIVYNDEFSSGNNSLQSQIIVIIILEEADHDHASSIHDFDDWFMDIDVEDDERFFSIEHIRIASEDEEDSNERDEENVEDLLQMLTIDSNEKFVFEDEDREKSVDEELEDLDGSHVW